MSTGSTQFLGVTATCLPTPQNVIARQVEYIHDQLRNCIAADPEEDSLTVFNKEQAMPFEPLGRQGQSGWHDNAILTNGSSLAVTRHQSMFTVQRFSHITSGGIECNE